MRTKTLDNSTRAALSAHTGIDVDKYLAYFSRGRFDARLRGLSTRLPYWSRFLPMLGPRVFHWFYVQEHIRYGAVNPAVVLDRATSLVAVFTSLTAVGETPTPVLKFVRERLDLISPERSFDGARFAAPSLYSRTAASYARGQWSDFTPIVIDCLVSDESRCDAVKSRIKTMGWKALEMALEQAGRRAAPALVPVEIPEEVVRDAW